MGKYNLYIITAIILVLLLAAIKAIAKRNRSFTANNGSTIGGGLIKATHKCDITKVDRDAIIGAGSKNSNEVCYLQTWLNRFLGAGLVIDGDFGGRTAKAVTAFIPNAGLTFTLNTIKI